jgi:hypothetical protein
VTAEDEIGFGLRSLRKGWAFTVVRDLVQSLVANNDRISGEDLQTLYHLCQNTDDGKSIDERKERVRNLNLPADDIARITEQIEQPMGSVGSAMGDPNLKVGDPEEDDTDGAAQLRDCFERLLWQIHRTVTTDLRDINYDWRREYWSNDRIDTFSRLYRQNVHLNRIENGQQISLTGKDLNTTRQSRLPLYTEAYDLYDTYQRLQSDTLDPDIAALLADTLIVPTATPTLYELFCVFWLIRLLNAHVPGLKIQPIDGQTSALARLETPDRRIEVYHDQTGNIDFHESLDPDVKPSPDTFKRYQDAILEYTDALEALTNTDRDPILYSGRPDIIVETYDTHGSDDELTSLLIGEVKFSGQAQTFRRGLQELVTYRKFARYNGDYLDTESAVPLTALIITNGHETVGTAANLLHTNGQALKQGDIDTNRRIFTRISELSLSST